MKINIDKALQVCGNNNRYQKIFFLAVALTWFSVDFISITFPLLELMPQFQCKNDGVFEECEDNKYCSTTNEEDRRALPFAYHNIVTDFNLICNNTLIIMIGVSYTVGIFAGAFLASKFSDIWGRKPVLLFCQLLFAIAAFSATVVPNIYILLGVLFFIGIATSGGSMISFLFISECIAPHKRSVFGTLINSAFAFAGILYFTIYFFLKNWKIMAYISVGCDVIAGILILTYFTESPRFLMSKGYTQKALKSLHKIAKRNGKQKDFYKFLVSDLIIAKDIMNEADATIYKLKSETQNINKNTVISSESADNDKSLDKSLLDTSNETCANGVDYKMTIEEIIKKFKKERTDSGLTADTQASELNLHEVKKEGRFRDLFKYKSIRANFLICNLMWFIYSFTYFGISLCLKKNKSEVFIDGYIVYGAEGISYMITGILISIAFFGRKRTLSIMLCLTSISTFGYFFFKYFSLEPYDKILLFIARFAITSISSILYVYSTEIYPTVIRAKGLGINILFARIASILVPVIVELINPFLIFSVICILGFIFSFSLPETHGKELEDEIEEEKKKRKISSENIY